jgi:uncharacterized protein YegL
MQGTKMQLVHEALEEAILNLQLFNANASKTRYLVSIIRFGANAKTIAGPCKPGEITSSEICKMLDASEGNTNMADGLREAKKVVEVSLKTIADDHTVSQERCPGPLVLMLTDGVFTGENPIAAAQELHAVRTPAEPVSVYVGGVDFPPEAEEGMYAVATSGHFMRLVPADIPAFFAEAVHTLMEEATQDPSSFATVSPGAPPSMI